MPHTTAGQDQAAPQMAPPQQPLPPYVPAKSGPSWLTIVLLVVFGGPVLLVGGLFLCLVVIAAIGSSADAKFDEISAELNQTSFEESVTEQPFATPALDGPASSTQSDDDYDPFDLDV